MLEYVDAVAVHGFPLDWNHWQIHGWPDRLAEIQQRTGLSWANSRPGCPTRNLEELAGFCARMTRRYTG